MCVCYVCHSSEADHQQGDPAVCAETWRASNVPVCVCVCVCVCVLQHSWFVCARVSVALAWCLTNTVTWWHRHVIILRRDLRARVVAPPAELYVFHISETHTHTHTHTKHTQSTHKAHTKHIYHSMRTHTRTLLSFAVGVLPARRGGSAGGVSRRAAARAELPRARPVRVDRVPSLRHVPPPAPPAGRAHR